MVLIAGQEVRRPLGSGGFLGPLRGEKKKDLFRDPICVSAHLPEGDPEGLGGWHPGRVTQWLLVQCISQSPLPPKSPSTSPPHECVTYSPASLLSLTPRLLSFKKINISPPQLEGALKHFGQIHCLPRTHLVKPAPASGPYTSCALHRDCLSSPGSSSHSRLCQCPLLQEATPPQFYCLPNTHPLPRSYSLFSLAFICSC